MLFKIQKQTLKAKFSNVSYSPGWYGLNSSAVTLLIYSIMTEFMINLLESGASDNEITCKLLL